MKEDTLVVDDKTMLVLECLSESHSDDLGTLLQLANVNQREFKTFLREHGLLGLLSGLESSLTPNVAEPELLVAAGSDIAIVGKFGVGAGLHGCFQKGWGHDPIAKLSNGLESLLKTRQQYVKKYGLKRFNKIKRRNIRSKIDEIVDLVSPTASLQKSNKTRSQRKGEADRVRRELQERVYQATLPFFEETTSPSAEVVQFSRSNLREEIIRAIRPELDRLEQQLGGINKALIKQRILFGLDVDSSPPSHE